VRSRLRRAAPALALAGVLAGALALRLWFFGGLSFALLSDDSRYAAVAQNLANGHLPAGPTEWFGTRVAFLWPVAGVFAAAGASDYSAAVWPLAGSLASVAAAYLLGRDLASRRVGLVAAAVVAAAPVEVLMGTRLRPDALAPALAALAVWCALRAGRASGRATLAWALGAGALVGAGWSVRENALVMAPVAVAAGWGAGRRAIAPALAGAALAPLVAVALYGALGGRPLEPLTATAGAGELRSPIEAWSLGGSYAAMLWREAARPGALLFLVLPALALAALVLALRRQRRALLPAAWLAWAALYLEVGTLPNLTKPARYLTLCTVPAALLVALALDGLDGRLAVLAAAAPAAALVAAAVALGPLPAREHRAEDVVLLNRVAGRLGSLPPGPVLAEGYTWWAKLGVYLARGRLEVPAATDPAFLDAAARRGRRRLGPLLPRVDDYLGGYVVVGPAVRRSGWPADWGRFQARFRAGVPWDRLRLVARVGPARIYRWPDRPRSRGAG
jgi:4-amino-4-deoxy-L-arabinose transferase-like glycosyltransferase